MQIMVQFYNKAMQSQQDQMGNNILIEKTTFSSTVKQKLITQELKDLMTNKDWILNLNKYQRLEMKQVFVQMRVAEVENVQIWGIYTHNVLTDLCHVKFTHLKLLMLDSNRITNVQALSWGAFPNIQAISLNVNHICSFKSLNKWNSSTLRSISLKNNKINRMNLTPMKFDKLNQRSQILLECAPIIIHPEPILVNDISGFIKIQFEKLVNLQICSNQRISQRKVQNAMNKKWGRFSIVFSQGPH